MKSILWREKWREKWSPLLLRSFFLKSVFFLFGEKRPLCNPVMPFKAGTLILCRGALNAEQGCQMVNLQTKNSTFGYILEVFGIQMLVYIHILAICYILQ
jgi:hypothetical protein